MPSTMRPTSMARPSAAPPAADGANPESSRRCVEKVHRAKEAQFGSGSRCRYTLSPYRNAKLSDTDLLNLSGSLLDPAKLIQDASNVMGLFVRQPRSGG